MVFGERPIVTGRDESIDKNGGTGMAPPSGKNRR
jgi:hypothetical protein